jgi:hypothetical protein
MKPRLSEDSTALWLANELDRELAGTIPNRRICPAKTRQDNRY